VKIKPLPPLSGRERRPLAALAGGRFDPARLRPWLDEARPYVPYAAAALAVLGIFGVLYASNARKAAERSAAMYREAINYYTFQIPDPDSGQPAPVSSDEEKWQRAMAIFQQLHDTYGRSSLAPAAQLYVGHCRYRLRQYSQALEAYDAFLARHRRHELAPQAHLGRGACLEQLARYPEAYEAYRAVLDSGGALAYEGGLGAAHCLLRISETDPARWAEAHQILNRLAANPDSPGARAARRLRRLLADLAPAPQGGTAGGAGTR
jgi:tetratricopeptide (TPR) repeat protein